MPHARLAQTADLIPLLDLYRASDVSSPAEPIERAEKIWREILSGNGVAVFVSTADARIVASCMLISAPNLLRAGKSHALSRKCRDPSRIRRPRSRPRRGRGRACGSLGQGLLSRADAKRPKRPARASVLREVRFRAGAADRIRRPASRLKVSRLLRLRCRDPDPGEHRDQPQHQIWRDRLADQLRRQ